MRKPYKIVEPLQCEINAAVEMLLTDCGKAARRWRFFITNSRAGLTNYGAEFVTVPLWAYRKGAEYFLYYTAHELAHIFAPDGNNHGAKFMAAFKAICPPEFWYHELDYKPRNAAAAGIGAPE